jgi:hypothetical protein
MVPSDGGGEHCGVQQPSLVEPGQRGAVRAGRSPRRHREVSVEIDASVLVDADLQPHRFDKTKLVEQRRHDRRLQRRPR